MTYFIAEDAKYQENGSTYITVYGYNGEVSQPTSQPVSLFVLGRQTDFSQPVSLSVCPWQTD